MRKGFTFVEVLLAISIFAIVSILIYSLFHTGITTWRKMEGLLERYQELRLFEEKIGKELRNCIDMDIENKFVIGEEVYDFLGKEDFLLFYTLKGGEIKRVIYKKEKDERSSNELGIPIFSLKYQEEPFNPQPFKEENFQGEVIFDLIKEINFSYLERKREDGIISEDWKQTWGEDEETKGIPTQVKIGIVYYVPTQTFLRRKIDYHQISIDKYVDIATVPKI